MGNNQHNGNGRYSAKGMAKPVNFLCIAPDAHEVSVMVISTIGTATRTP